MKNRIKDKTKPQGKVTKLDETNGNGEKPTDPKPPIRSPTDPGDYWAIKIHNARNETMAVQEELAKAHRANGMLQMKVAGLEARIVEIEAAANHQANAVLRKVHRLEDGTTIHRDDETGEVYRLKPAE